MTRTQLRLEVKNCNLSLKNPQLTLRERQALVLKRETALTGVRYLQMGVSPTTVDSLMSSVGIQTRKDSGGNRTTLNLTEVYQVAMRGCSVRQMPMAFTANRIGRARTVHNLKSDDSRGRMGRIVRSRKGGRKIISAGSVNATRANAVATESFRAKTSDGTGVPLVIRGSVPESSEAKVGSTLQDHVRLSEVRRGRAYSNIS